MHHQRVLWPGNDAARAAKEISGQQEAPRTHQLLLLLLGLDQLLHRLLLLLRERPRRPGRRGRLQTQHN